MTQQNTPTKLPYYCSADGYIRSTEPPTPGRVQGQALCKPAATGAGAEQFGRREFILRCVNAHDDLVAALKDAQKTVEKRFIECGRQGANAHTTNPLRTEWEHCRATLHEIEAALAKAKASA